MPTRERFPVGRAYGGTSRPEKCMDVRSLDSSLPVRRSFRAKGDALFGLRNMESTAITIRGLYDFPYSQMVLHLQPLRTPNTIECNFKYLIPIGYERI